MKYTGQEIEQIVDQLRAVKINGSPVFIAWIDDVETVYHTILLDIGMGIQTLEFEKAPESTESKTEWKAIEEQAKADLEAVQTDKDAYAFIGKYLSKDLQGRYLQIYRSDRHEMNRTPRQALDNILSLPPIE